MTPYEYLIRKRLSQVKNPAFVYRENNRGKSRWNADLNQISA